MNKQDTFGRTALHYAAITGNQKLMDLLETKKTDTEIQDKFGKTAADYVTMQDAFDEFVDLLQSSPTKGLFNPSYCQSIPVCIKQCFEERCSESVEYAK